MLSQTLVSRFRFRQSHPLREGYTLIELLITISITMVLVTLGISAYRRAADIQAIKADTEKILEVIASAQKAATSGQADCTATYGPYLGERLTTTTGSSTLTLTSACRNGDGESRQFSLSTFTFATNNTLVFQPLNQGIDTGATDTQNLDYSRGDILYRIEVTRAGTVKPLGEIEL